MTFWDFLNAHPFQVTLGLWVVALSLECILIRREGRN
jgi:hypothetical protein